MKPIRTCRRLPLLLVALAQVGCVPVCENEVLSTGWSSDGRHKAVVYLRSCGATSDYSANLSVLAARDVLGTGVGNVLVIRDTLKVQGPLDYPAGPVLRIAFRWDGPTRLVVSHDARAWTILRERRYEGVAVEYQQPSP